MNPGAVYPYGKFAWGGTALGPAVNINCWPRKHKGKNKTKHKVSLRTKASLMVAVLQDRIMRL